MIRTQPTPRTVPRFPGSPVPRALYIGHLGPPVYRKPGSPGALGDPGSWACGVGTAATMRSRASAGVGEWVMGGVAVCYPTHPVR